MNSFIYLVGAPDSQHIFTDTIRQLGYKVGLFLDQNKTLRNPGDYDKVIPLDFADLERSLLTLPSSEELQIRGLVCTYENYILAKARLAQHLHLPGLSMEAAAASTDKRLMREAFQQQDPLITPRFAVIDSLEQAQAFALSASYPVIIKPTNLVKSLLVLKCSTPEELANNFQHAHNTIADLYRKYRIYNRHPQLIIEQYVTGNLYSIAAFVDSTGKPHFCPGVVKLTNAHDIGINDNYLYSRMLPAQLSSSDSERMFSVARQGVQALGLKSTPAHIEIIANDTEVKLVEIGARIGGYRPRMYSYSYDIDLAEQEVRLAVGESPVLASSMKAYCSVYELFPKTKGTFTSIGSDKPTDISQFAYFSVKSKPGVEIGLARDGYKAAGIVIVTSDDKVVFQQLCEAAEQLHVQVAA